MKRTIKFRAWDKEQSKMIMGVQCVCDYKLLMQYTGIKDKNGKEIYEGDIVRDDDGAYEVCWKESCYVLAFSDNKYDYVHDVLTEDTDREWKIIGNIYETPELLSSNIEEV